MTIPPEVCSGESSARPSGHPIHSPVLRAITTAVRGVLLRLGLKQHTRLDTAALGRAGEAHAVKTLKAAGYTILDRNVQLPMGEVDIVARDPDQRTIVLVEVKCRVLSEGAHPPPEAQVNARKRRVLVATLRYLTAANNWQARPKRIDVIAIDWGRQGAIATRHYQNAVKA